ncbi:type II toxin-antitoxin system MqsR family toxin, partial [Escherichia coli]|uniref:type II toxin-antitoxin system MqsR family toxin n=1 Tax=Escherichia coli TaxID=562 RepID=UPI001FCE4671
MEKRTPHTRLSQVKKLVNAGQVRTTRSALLNADELGLDFDGMWICPYISRHLLSLNPLLACCRRYSR